MSSAKLILVCALLVLCAFVADVDAQYYWPSYYGGYGGYGYGGYGYGSYYGYPYSYCELSSFSPQRKFRVPRNL